MASRKPRGKIPLFYQKSRGPFDGVLIHPSNQFVQSDFILINRKKQFQKFLRIDIGYENIRKYFLGGME